jgi:hypothetical protein
MDCKIARVKLRLLLLHIFLAIPELARCKKFSYMPEQLDNAMGTKHKLFCSSEDVG